MSYNKQIGGEFSSNQIFRENKFLNKYQNGTWTLSGRYALEIILKKNNYLVKKNIYIPIFNCPSVHQTIKKYFKKIYFYDLDLNLNPKLKKIKKNSVILLVNYFGLQTKKIKKNIIIEDLSHCFLDKKKLMKNRFYFMSLRKLGIFNFGGWSNIEDNKNLNKKAINFMEKYRIKKHNYLNLLKKDENLEKKLLNELQIEENKIIRNNTTIKKNQIPLITNKKLNVIKRIRKRNYNFLKKNLVRNYFDLKINKKNTPLFFFLKFSNKLKRDNFRNLLKSKKIFCPIFWNIKNKDLKKYPISKMLSEKLLALPIDHRIAKADLKYMTKTINLL